MPANIRPSASAAASSPSSISSAAPACGRSERRWCWLFGNFVTTPEYVWRGVWLLIGVGALIVWVFRFTLPESPRFLATHGRGDEALKVLERLGIKGPTEPLSSDAASNTKSDPIGIVFRMFPVRVVAGMICFTAFFGVAIGLGAWLPNMMNAKGFSITKSLQYTLVMNFAVPCASIFMMYALDKYGRKITSVCAFVAAGLMAIVFANAGTPMELMIAGFIMVFFVQVAGNSMQIFTSEVFPDQRARLGLRSGPRASAGSRPRSSCRPFCGYRTAGV